jgi:MSHA pilin protein MshA
MKTKQQGFTLIELVVVIVLLGIIGAVATARFQNLAGDARSAAQRGIAAEIQSSSALNYADGALDGGYDRPVTGAQTCAAAAASLLTSGALPSGWDVNTDPIAGCGTAGNPTTNCTIIDNPVTLGAINIVMICTG